MEDDIIGIVVEVEKEVEEKIKAEKKLSQDWLENAKKEAAQRVLAEEEAMKEASHEAINSAKLMSEKKADAAVQEAGLLAERLEGLGDDILKKIVSRYLSGTLPGQ